MNEIDFLHKLSNPVTVSLGMVESAQRKLEMEQSKEALQKLEISLLSLKEVVELIQNRRIEVSAQSDEG